MSPLKKTVRKRKTDGKKTSSASANFETHLEEIKEASAKSLSLIKENISAKQIPQATLSLAWEIVFDIFLKAKERELEAGELNTLSGVLQKLVSAQNSVKSADENKSARGLSEDAIREIEAKLKLL